MTATEQPIRFYNGADVYTAGPLDWHSHGYAIAYYPVDEHGSTVGDVVCPDCANAELQDGVPSGMPDGTAGYIADCAANSDYEHNVTCDNCNNVIMYQTYCYECKEPVDCDEDNPIHACPNAYAPTYPGSYEYNRAERDG